MHTTGDTHFNIEVKKLNERLSKMKNETNFVEKLKLKISAKNLQFKTLKLVKLQKFLKVILLILILQ